MKLITPDECKAMLGKRHKYNATRTTVDGISFASKRESQRYAELRLVQKAGNISQLTIQPKFILLPAFKDSFGNHHRAITYKADFSYIENGRFVAEDVKGMETKEFRIKRKLFAHFYPAYELRIVK